MEEAWIKPVDLTEASESLPPVAERFLRYAAVDTQSDETSGECPSTPGQWTLARMLERELAAMGASQVRVSEHGYVYAKIPANVETADGGKKRIPAVGFIAHMDTSDALSGAGVRPQLVQAYDGRDIALSQDAAVMLRTADFPELLHYLGKDLITTDGTTLLGADDKAGVAEIMEMAAYFLAHPEVPHGDILIGFTPDEEIGRGADLFDVAGFGADVAYTVDGGALGELEYENFNAASLRLTVNGRSIHPGSAKGRMKNALLIGMEFQSLLPAFDNPMYTEGYEGFFHLTGMSGSVEKAQLDYIIRDHDRALFERRKKLALEAARFLNQKYGEGTVEAEITDSYYNMREKIEPAMFLIDNAKAAMEAEGVTPIISPIRGGTDGARLSYMGLPCPNLCTGGHNFHGRYEFICVQSMETVVEILKRLVCYFAK